MKYHIAVPIIIFVVGMAVIIPIGVVQYNNEQNQTQDRLNELATSYSDFLSISLRTFKDVGKMMQLIYNAEPYLDRVKHEIMANEILRIVPGIQVIGRALPVQHADRAAEEASASAYINSSVVFHDFGGNPSPVKDEYLPIVAVTPLEGNEPALLLDLQESPVWPLANSSIKLGIDVVTPGFSLIQETGNQKGIVVFYPTYTGTPQTEEERIAQYSGLAETVLRMQDWLNVRMVNLLPLNVIITIIDQTDNILASVDGNTGTWQVSSVDVPGVEKNITVAHTTWKIRVSQSGILIEPSYYLTFAIGIPLITIIAVFIYIVLLLVKKNFDIRNEMYETQQQTNKQKQQFIHYIFHEIRVPFQTIKLGLLNLQKYLIDTEESDETFDAINSSINHANSILNDMLDMGKMESGKFRMNASLCSLTGSLELPLNAFKLQMQEKGLEFVVDIQQDLYQKLFIIDANRIIQCVSNLLSNAYKYTNSGTVKFSMEVLDRIYANDEQWTIEVSVVDTGIGIAEEDQKKLFQPYEQITNKSNEIGTGLGLNICKNIINMHGGEINCESKINEGSRFWFTFQAVVQDKPRNYQVDRKQSSSLSENILSSSILIVDDNVNNCKAFGEFMKHIGFIDIEFAHNGLNALSKIQEHGPYDIVFMDMHMPKMDGQDCVREIRKQYGQENYIIMLTGAYLDPNKIIDIGANDLLHKPLQIDQFFRALRIFGDSKK